MINVGPRISRGYFSIPHLNGFFTGEGEVGLEGMQYEDFLNQIIFDKSPINVLALSLWGYEAQLTMDL